MLPKITNTADEEMRAFYTSCGFRETTIEAAIRHRREHPFKAKKLSPTDNKEDRKLTLTT
jgi:hypothetical protein